MNITQNIYLFNYLSLEWIYSKSFNLNNLILKDIFFFYYLSEIFDIHSNDRLEDILFYHQITSIVKIHCSKVIHSHKKFLNSIFE